MDWLPQLGQSILGILRAVIRPEYISAFGTLLIGIGTFLGILRVRGHSARQASSTKRTSETWKSETASPQHASVGAHDPTNTTTGATSQPSSDESDSATANSALANRVRKSRDLSYEAAKKAVEALTEVSVRVHWLTQTFEPPHDSAASFKQILAAIHSVAQHLGRIHDSAQELSKRLDKLSISWQENDPRITILACANPLSPLFRRSSGHEVVTTFEQAAGKIAAAITKRGYFVSVTRKDGNLGPMVYRLLNWSELVTSYGSDEEIFEAEIVETIEETIIVELRPRSAVKAKP